MADATAAAHAPQELEVEKSSGASSLAGQSQEPGFFSRSAQWSRTMAIMACWPARW